MHNCTQAQGPIEPEFLNDLAETELAKETFSRYVLD
jgi:hypothetical protein